MKTPDHAPIPIPLSHRWRDFRIRFVPFLIFAITLVVIGTLWRQAVAPASLTGQVEPIKASVSSPLAGAIVELTVDRFQSVKAGTLIARVRPGDPRESLDLMRSQLDLLRTSTDPQAAQRREAVDYQKLRLSWLQQKVDLSTAQIKLQFAGVELERATKLYGQKAITEKAYDLTLKQKQAVESQVEERGKLVADLEKALEALRVAGPVAGQGADSDAFQKTLRAQDAQMRQIEENLQGLALTAPIDGMVTSIVHWTGENVPAGEPIVVLTATHSDRIVGYLREPFPLDPQVGMEVDVQTRTSRRINGRGLVTHLGVEFEPITNPALHPAASPEVGLAIEVSLPPGLPLRPGELVSLVIRPKR